MEATIVISALSLMMFAAAFVIVRPLGGRGYYIYAIIGTLFATTALVAGEVMPERILHLTLTIRAIQLIGIGGLLLWWYAVGKSWYAHYHGFRYMW
jgi:hypothetical protein